MQVLQEQGLDRLSVLDGHGRYGRRCCQKGNDGEWVFQREGATPSYNVEVPCM